MLKLLLGDYFKILFCLEINELQTCSLVLLNMNELLNSSDASEESAFL